MGRCPGSAAEGVTPMGGGIGDGGVRSSAGVVEGAGTGITAPGDTPVGAGPIPVLGMPAGATCAPAKPDSELSVIAKTAMRVF